MKVATEVCWMSAEVFGQEGRKNAVWVSGKPFLMEKEKQKRGRGELSLTVG